jgi:DNA helicase-2/ATP-dependent DNA helicase PcrA
MSPTQQVPDSALPPAVPQGRRASAASKRRPRKIKALRELNPEQEAAVTHPPGMILVIAGAGSGKTRVLTRRGAFLIDVRGVDPESLLFITLTNKAAREMVDRLHKLCGPAVERIHAGTFHSMCAGVLRTHAKLIGRTSQFSIYDKDEAQRVVARRLTRAEKSLVKPVKVQRQISAAKNHDVTVERYASFATDPTSRLIARVWREYEEELRRADALDFDDLLLRTVRVLRSYPDIRRAYQEKWPHILVDEYQDTNPIQARLLRLLASDDLFVVGDDRQVIYGFRLANVRLILDFDKEYKDATVFTLERNYRSSPKILDAANNLIANNTVQSEMRLVPDEKNEEGPAIVVRPSVNDVEEARWIASRIQRYVASGVHERDIAVLGRGRKVVEGVEHALAAAGISYQLVGSHGYFKRPEVRAALAHLRLIVNPRNEEAFATALGIRPQVGDKTIAKIVAYAGRHRLSLLEASTAVDLIGGVDKEGRENVRRFAYDMLAFRRRAREISVSELTHEVIRMPLGVADSLAREDDGEQRFARLEALREAARTYERQTDNPTLAGWLQDATLAGRDDLSHPESDRGRVTLGTIHAIKGLEWAIVIAAGFDRRLIPSFYARTPAALEEERRMAFVLFTRTIKELTLSYAATREGRPSGPSRFISEALKPPGDELEQPPRTSTARAPALNTP